MFTPMENSKCENCGKALEDFRYTHCSEECLFDSIKNSIPFTPKGTKDNSDTTSTEDYS